MSAGAIAATASSTAVLVAVVFGILTIRQWVRSRQLAAAAELVRTMQTGEFTRSIARIIELPLDEEASKLLGDREVLASFYAVSHVFESLGVLVYHRLLPLHLVDHLCGGYVRASWKRVRPIVLAQRENVGPMFGEWYEWLANRIDQFPAPGKDVGAPVAFKDWRP
ncbi:MAG TPA: hypothetical protein VGH28_34295 [Polyangiaceae bacterium]|jgi:hypothetical protein